jgi:hypothetical protein
MYAAHRSSTLLKGLERFTAAQAVMKRPIRVDASFPSPSRTAPPRPQLCVPRHKTPAKAADRTIVGSR